MPKQKDREVERHAHLEAFIIPKPTNEAREVQFYEVNFFGSVDLWL